MSMSSIPIFRAISVFVLLTFLGGEIFPASLAQAQVLPTMPMPGEMLNISPAFTPPIIKAITIHPENPLRFNFIIYDGDNQLQGEALKKETEKMAKYFLAALAIPEKDLWVNLSPYEKDRITTEQLGITEMGRDLLAQDYVLKQLMASLTYPESGLGKKFWDRVYKKAYELYGTTNIPLNTFNKVWIVPDTAKIFEQGGSTSSPLTAFIVSSHLKVMLEEDYLALKENFNNAKLGTNKLPQENVEKVSNVSSAIAREVLLPEIEKEVNEGENFAMLRQIYSALILALWYKKTLKESLLGQVYADQSKVKGVDVEDKTIRKKIYQQYLEAFKKGVYSFIKEDDDPYMQKKILRKYFSGGFEVDEKFTKERMPSVTDEAMLTQVEQRDLTTTQAQRVTDERMHNVELQFAEEPEAPLLVNWQEEHNVLRVMDWLDRRQERYKDNEGRLAPFNFNVEDLARDLGISEQATSAALEILGRDRQVLKVRNYDENFHVLPWDGKTWARPQAVGGDVTRAVLMVCLAVVVGTGIPYLGLSAYWKLHIGEVGNELNFKTRVSAFYQYYSQRKFPVIISYSSRFEQDMQAALIFLKNNFPRVYQSFQEEGIVFIENKKETNTQFNTQFNGQEAGAYWPGEKLIRISSTIGDRGTIIHEYAHYLQRKLGYLKYNEVLNEFESAIVDTLVLKKIGAVNNFYSIILDSEIKRKGHKKAYGLTQRLQGVSKEELPKILEELKYILDRHGVILLREDWQAISENIFAFHELSAQSGPVEAVEKSRSKVVALLKEKIEAAISNLPEITDQHILGNDFEKLKSSSAAVVDGAHLVASVSDHAEEVRQGVSPDYGGIDVTNVPLQIKRDQNGVPPPLPLQNIPNIHLEGLFPIILDVQPATFQNLPFLLSLSDQKNLQLTDTPK